MNDQGYILIHKPEHPRANCRGYVREHIVIAEQAIGRLLPLEAEVHHVNEVRSENDGSNLVICQDKSYHHLLHRRTRAMKATGDPNNMKCKFCKQWGRNDMTQSSKQGSYHLACRADYVRLRSRQI